MLAIQLNYNKKNKPPVYTYLYEYSSSLCVSAQIDPHNYLSLMHCQPHKSFRTCPSHVVAVPRQDKRAS